MSTARPDPAAAAAAAAAAGGEIVACAQCDLRQQLPSRLPVGTRARCARCSFVLVRAPGFGHDSALAMSLAAAIAYVLAQTSALVGLSVLGRSTSTNIVGGVLVMWHLGEPLTAALVLFCAVVAPGAYIAAMLALLIAARRPTLPRWCGTLLSLGERLQPWAMFDVMLLGILVALTKLAELASVETGVGLYAIAALALLFPAMLVGVDARQLWLRIRWAAPSARPGADT